MSDLPRDKKFFIVSMLSHIGILLFFVLGFDHTSTIPVFENTNKNDVISAIVLGDTAKSKILPKQITPEPPPPVAEKQKPKPAAQTEVIALKPQVDKKKLAQQKALEALKKPLFGKNLLSDIKKQKSKAKPKNIFEQTEKTLRQELMNEQIKLQSTISRQAQGEVNKYKALIVQAISEKWIVPVQANKRLYTQVMIRLAPGGMVLDVQVIKTSGDPSLDSSARAAVLKASPLPVPEDKDAFDAFRQFVLKVKPENIMEAGLI